MINDRGLADICPTLLIQLKLSDWHYGSEVNSQSINRIQTLMIIRSHKRSVDLQNY